MSRAACSRTPARSTLIWKSRPILKKLDGGPALMFTQVDGYDVPLVGNFLACPANCEAAFGVDYTEIRKFVERALGNPIEPQMVTSPSAQQVVMTEGIDIGATLPVLHHTKADGGRFMTAGIVIFRDPDTGVHNASYHRLQLLGPGQTAIKLDFGRHLRLAFERAQARGQDLPVAICIGADVSLHYVAATMGAQLPEDADELGVAGGIAGQPLAIAKTLTQDAVIAADAEIVIEGAISASETVMEGPFGEFMGLMSSAGDMPVVNITALTHREKPIYHAINGYGRETIVLRKYVMEATLLKTIKAAVPIVKDVDMPPGSLHRFKAVIQIEKTSTQHEGLARNVMLAAFGALKDLDLVIVVDEDIDIQDPADIDYALAMRFDAGRDLVVIPDARSHELVRYTRDGIRAKFGIDATRPFAEKDRYTRLNFADTDKTMAEFDEAPAEIVGRLIP